GSLELKKRGALKLSQEELDKVNIRENLRETAFFYPHLTMDQNNTVTFDFTVPDALTGWKLLLFAHGKECQNGGLVAQAVTRKKLMVQPNAPRFLREGDTLHFTARITNLSDSALNALVNLEIKDFSSEQKVNQQFGVDDATAETGIPAGESKTVSWRLVVPYGSGPVTYTVRAVSDNHSDGQLGVLPVLSSKKMVTESVPLSIRGPAEKRYEFGKLRQLDTSKTLKPHAFTAQMASNPSWYVLQAFPYLMEFPHECSEQLFSRVYANSLGAHIVKFYPRIKEVLADWHESGSLKSNLHKNKHFKSVLLDQTPWARDARAETDRKIRLSNLLSDSAVTRNISTAMDKLGERQLDNGMWAWFEEKPDTQITICIVAGFGKLNSMGVDVDLSMAKKALVALDKWFLDGYAKRDSSQFNGRFRAIPYYLYARSFFLDEKPLGSSLKTALDYYLDNLESDWPKLYSRMSEGHAALVLNRFGRSETAQAIVESLKERSVLDEEMGRFWRDDEGTWNWYRAPVESQVVMIEALSEVTSDTAAVDECKRWLIKQKQTHSWHSTRATADAVYALVMRDGNPLEDDKLVRMSLGETDITPEEGEAGTGYYEKRFAADEIKSDFCSIMVNKESEGIAWGGVYFQYTDDLSRITPHETDLKLEKKLFVNRNAKGGQVMTPVRGPLEVGDLVTVRLIVRVDRSMEYVHIKDMRPSGFEPVDVLSRSRYIAGTRFFQSTKDAATHFFIDFLPEGDHVLEYRLRVVHAGTYQSGIAEIRNMYAPEFGGHSGSVEVKVR
ncbi:MAG: alpha-2-macroglobulin family protein, partial [Chitinispirillaceae bacterium]